MSKQMLIVGGGQAGARAAQTLRSKGWQDQITIICKEDHLPYERPPLSKDVLLNGRKTQDCLVHQPDFYVEQGINLHLATEVLRIDRLAHRVELSTGEELPYHRLLLAMGAKPRRLSTPGAERSNVVYLRTAADAMNLSQRLSPGVRCVIIGGGLIGLEVAASARGLGCDVCVVEAAPQLLTRAVPKQLSARLHARHTEAGVKFYLAAQVARLEGSGAETMVKLTDGAQLGCDIVIAGIGASPNTELASECGLSVEDGVLVDPTLQTEDPAIYVAGDACRYFDPVLNSYVRQETWKSAEEQGRLAAGNMLGAHEPYSATPWFWSHQYELTLQVAGAPARGTRTVERPGDGDSLILFHLFEDGRVAGVSSVAIGTAASKDMRIGQMLIEQQIKPDPVALVESKNLKSFLQTAVH